MNVSYLDVVNKHKSRRNGGAAVAQWICLRLPYCHGGFESLANHLHFYKFIFEL